MSDPISFLVADSKEPQFKNIFKTFDPGIAMNPVEEAVVQDSETDQEIATNDDEKEVEIKL